jgi:hypothetical protein
MYTVVGGKLILGGCDYKHVSMVHVVHVVRVVHVQQAGYVIQNDYVI